MAPRDSRPRRSPRYSPCQNPPPTSLVEDELTRDLGPVGGPYLGSSSPAPSRNSTPGHDQVLALVPALANISALTPVPTNQLFKKFIKAYLESNQGPKQPPTKRKQLFKAKVPEVYEGKLHMDCYHFCQQSKAYFETAGATGTNRTSVAAFFLCENISVR